MTTPTPESPSVSVNRELLESLVMDVRNAAVCLDVSSALVRQAVLGALDTAVVLQAEVDGTLTQPQPAPVRVTVEREILELVRDELNMHADALRPAGELDLTVHGLDGLHSLLSGALDRANPEPVKKSAKTLHVGGMCQSVVHIPADVSSEGESALQVQPEASAPAALPAEVREVLLAAADYAKCKAELDRERRTGQRGGRTFGAEYAQDGFLSYIERLGESRLRALAERTEQ